VTGPFVDHEFLVFIVPTGDGRACQSALEMVAELHSSWPGAPTRPLRISATTVWRPCWTSCWHPRALDEATTVSVAGAGITVVSPADDHRTRTIDPITSGSPTNAER
jgi:hypothetical protein